MTTEIFIMGLLIVSSLTSLCTEAIKSWLTERGKSYYANALAGYCSVGLSVLVGAGYIILTEAQLNASMAVYLIALMLLSWLSGMLGYDKVIQMLNQIKGV